MKRLVFIDMEADTEGSQIRDAGAVDVSGRSFHSGALSDFKAFVAAYDYVCGHNLVRHDWPLLLRAGAGELGDKQLIDTLVWSPLLFPKQPYHALVKDDKLQTDALNNPLNDAQKARELFEDEVGAFRRLDEDFKQILYGLLHETVGFGAFFLYVDFVGEGGDLVAGIRSRFKGALCADAPLALLVEQHPVDLAYGLALIAADSPHSITPPWVLKQHPDVERVLFLLCGKPCLRGCGYCDQWLDARRGLKRFFGFDAYRSYGGKSLQEDAVNAALQNKSLLAVFPTGGGKSITFQVPALMYGENVKGLTVVISPLQSLMKDQVDNLERANITEAVTINGLLDPIERAKSFERVENGSASILYISPESLRSRSIEHLLLGRNVVRFVIDEAHCFSAWGQDFRVDYLYIGDFIRQLQEKKNLSEPIPVSCFTATAKQNVIQDIKNYFRDKLGWELETFSTQVSRSNLQFKVLPKNTEDEKYQTLRGLIDARNCPAIVYVSRTRRAFQLAERLSSDGYSARAYHGKMDKQEKSDNQDAFIRGEVQVMVATSAFGMGVDKKDVGLVVHFEISDSLENYVQEAGRAGRDENITAECFVLYNEEDLSKHFILLNQTKLSIKEIQQIWRAIKDLTKLRLTASNSALEIARKAGWDDNVADMETRVTTALAALEEAGYVKRGQNMPRIFANSILSPNAQEAIDAIMGSSRFNDRQRDQAVRIIKKLFSSKTRQQSSDEVAESRIDYISDHLGIVKEEVIQAINLLREEQILADTKDLTAYLRRGEHSNRSLEVAVRMGRLEACLLEQLREQEQIFHLKALNELALEKGCTDVSPQHIRTLLNFWVIKNWVKRKTQPYGGHQVSLLANYPLAHLRDKMKKRHDLARFIVDLLYAKGAGVAVSEASGLQLLSFSVHELKQAYEQSPLLFKHAISLQDVEDALFYLSRIEALKLDGGFLVVYNKLSVERLETDNKKRYKAEDYERLKQFYENKVQQIHIVGEYAQKMISDYRGALQFVEDYFQLNYSSFLNKYFNGSRQKELSKNITPAKFRQLFGSLSPAQLSVIKDSSSPYIAVAAGPGSGKTKVLVHKLASLLLMEDVKHEQLLMLTFSRAAATEFKSRLQALIGNAAAFVEIKTFHAYCFDLLGKMGTLEKSETIIAQAIAQIRENNIEPNRINKAVLVIDEAQDMDAREYELVRLLMERNEELRVIAVGDDDQNIYAFRGSSSVHLEHFIKDMGARKYELNDNFRSASNLVAFTNAFVPQITHRLKDLPIVARRKEEGRVGVTRYEQGRFLPAVVQEVLGTDLKGSTCVLTPNNEQALQMAGLLTAGGLPARLIQSNEGFSLLQMLELRFFMDALRRQGGAAHLNDELWQAAKKLLWDRYRNSSKIQLCINLIKAFQVNYPRRRYYSDLEVFVRESRLEDFVDMDGEKVFVSTMHKAKGREFDNVFVMLEGFVPDNDEKRRLLYVAMTRAKNSLSLHVQGTYLEGMDCEGLQRRVDRRSYAESDVLVLHPGHKDLWLDYFLNRQGLIKALMSGDPLEVDAEGCMDEKKRSLLKFSTAFKTQLTAFEAKGYRLDSARVNYVLYWKKEGADQESLIVLPELSLLRLI